MANDAGKDAGGDSRALDDSSVVWDERYRSADALWSGQPKPQLVTEAACLTPGTALDVGCGEGADALWLAARGWQVTAVDISIVAVERGAAEAHAIDMDVAQRTTWLQTDLTNWIPAAASYALVAAQFLHLPRERREALFRRLAAAVAPGGSLLIVGHHPLDLQTIPRPLSPDRLFTAPDVAALLDSHEWDIVVSSARERGATDPVGRSVIIHDAVLRARSLLPRPC